MQSHTQEAVDVMHGNLAVAPHSRDHRVEHLAFQAAECNSFDYEWNKTEIKNKIKRQDRKSKHCSVNTSAQRNRGT